MRALAIIMRDTKIEKEHMIMIGIEKTIEIGMIRIAKILKTAKISRRGIILTAEIKIIIIKNTTRKEIITKIEKVPV